MGRYRYLNGSVPSDMKEHADASRYVRLNRLRLVIEEKTSLRSGDEAVDETVRDKTETTAASIGEGSYGSRSQEAAIIACPRELGDQQVASSTGWRSHALEQRPSCAGRGLRRCADGRGHSSGGRMATPNGLRYPEMGQ